MGWRASSAHASSCLLYMAEISSRSTYFRNMFFRYSLIFQWFIGFTIQWAKCAHFGIWSMPPMHLHKASVTRFHHIARPDKPDNGSRLAAGCIGGCKAGTGPLDQCFSDEKAQPHAAAINICIR